VSGLSYKEEMSRAMLLLAADPARRFIGYGIRSGRAMGTLKGVADAQLIETPVAENLMSGLAIGLSLCGLKPVVFIERCDFLLNALDAIVNHLDKIELMSHGQFQPAVILRVVVGNRDKPLYTGATHTQDFSKAMAAMVRFPVFRLKQPEEIRRHYEEAARAIDSGHSTMLVEYKDLL
jgi:2-oxoisovalerate dehydrogenase E1 component